jgi:DNA-binding transcriptional MerR regulator
MDKKTYSLKELSEITGIKARTIRYYISKNLLPPPVKRGRNSGYGEEHIKRLKEIQKLKEKGLLLKEISLKAGSVNLPEPETFASYKVSDDVTVIVKSDVSPWRAKKINEAIVEMINKLNSGK